MNRHYEITWNLIPLFAAFGALTMRMSFPDPMPGVLSSYGFDFGLASIFGFVLGRHVLKVHRFANHWSVSLLAAVCVGIAATVFEFMYPHQTVDPLDIVAYWTGVTYASVGLWFLWRFEHKYNQMGK